VAHSSGSGDRRRHHHHRRGLPQKEEQELKIKTSIIYFAGTINVELCHDRAEIIITIVE